MNLVADDGTVNKNQTPGNEDDGDDYVVANEKRCMRWIKNSAYRNYDLLLYMHKKLGTPNKTD